MRFFIKLALRNLLNNKKRSLVFMTGVIIFISVITSITLWADSSEEFIQKGFLEDIDYDMLVRAYSPARIHDTKEWMSNRSEVLAADEFYFNSVLFNAENKNPFYQFLPFELQDDLTDPVSFGTLLLPPKEALNRLTKQFNVTGDFSLEKNEVLVSEYQAQRLAFVYNHTIQPGMVVNLSVCRNSPELSQYQYVFAYQPRHFTNVTIRGIYRKVTTPTMLQKTFSDDFLYKSSIFLQENLIEPDLEEMEDNGLHPIILSKLTIDYLTVKGLSEMYNQIEDFYSIMRTLQPYTLTEDISDLFSDLTKTYSRAKMQFFILSPIVFFSLASSGILLNQLVSNRRHDIALLQNRNSSNKQIIGILILEYVILVLIASLIALLLSYVFTATLPTVSSSILTIETFKYYLLSLRFPFISFFSSLGSILLTVILFVIFRTRQVLNRQLSEKLRASINKRLRVLFLLFGFVFSTLIFGLLLYLVIKLNREISSISSYTYGHVRQSSLTLVLLVIYSFCLIAFSIVSTMFFLTKAERMLTKTFPKIGFFLNHNFKHNRINLMTILFIFLTVSFSAITTLTLTNILNHNDQSNTYYNNGADLRIHTLPVDYNFRTILTEHEGIENALPVFELSGKVTNDHITIFGVNPVKYGQIGRWDKSSFNHRYLPDEFKDFTSAELVEQLEEQPYGIIISEGIAEKYGYEFEDIIRIDSIPTPVGQGSSQFIVVGVIHSAPGLGLASQASPFLNQMNDDFVLINEERIILDYQIEEANLFFADLNETFTIDTITKDLQKIENVLEINPSFTMKGMTYKYVANYLPNFQFFLIVEFILICIVGLTLGFSFVNFAYSKRTKVAIILSWLGNTYSDYAKLVLIELSILLLFGTTFGFTLSLLVLFIMIFLVTPFLTEPVVIPMTIEINPLYTILVFGLIILTFYLSLIPHLNKLAKNNPLNLYKQDDF